MVERRQDVLRLRPQMIPSMRASVASAVDQLDTALVHLRQNGHLTAQWMGDETSSDVVAHYTRQAMDGPQSAYDSLITYREELTRVHDTLQQMEADYRRREGDNAALWGRMA
jgi:Zn-dependent alcohol dehydrogenase